MHRNHRADCFSGACFPSAAIASASSFEAFLNRGGSDVVRRRIDIGEKRRGANARDTSSGGKKRKGRGDNCVASSDPERHQNIEQRVGSRRNANSMRDITIPAYRILERLHFWPKNETAAGKNFVCGIANRVAQKTILLAEIEKGHAHGEKLGSFATPFKTLSLRQWY